METPASTPYVPAHHSALSPLREPLFRSLWIAAVISYTGSWMQNVATGWLMTSLTSSPMWVALVQVAVSLPVLLIALPAVRTPDPTASSNLSPPFGPTLAPRRACRRGRGLGL